MVQNITLEGKAYVIIAKAEYDDLVLGNRPVPDLTYASDAPDAGREAGLSESDHATFLRVEDEDAEDEAFALAAWQAHQSEKAAGRGLSMPKEQWARIRSGDSALRVIREYRGLQQTELAAQSGIARPEISAIEARKRKGTAQTLKKLAAVLGSPMELIVEDIES